MDAHLSRSAIALAAAAAVLVAGCSRAASERTQPSATGRPDIVLVTIDTLRADRLDARLMPAVDAFARSAVRFTGARSAVPLTLPSHTTIMTGLLPPSHGVHENAGAPLDARHPTIAAGLRARGYRTAAFVGAFVLDRRFGLARGFDTYDDEIQRDPEAADRLEAERPAADVVDRALAWMDRADGTSPFFVWIHLYDPHAPYAPPREYLERARAARADRESPRDAAYDGEVAYADANVGRVLDWLRARHLLDRTVVAIAGDHGEGLGDHGEAAHGMLLYDSTLRVPLVVSAPGRAPSERGDPVGLADIAPTLLRAGGAAVPSAMQGRDLFGPASDRDIYSETEYPRVAGWSPLHALTDGRWSLILAARGAEAYDLRGDPGQLRDVAASQASLVLAMAARVEALRATSSPPATPALSDEAAERLRALGYVASSAAPVRIDAPSPVASITDWNAFETALADLNARQPGAVDHLQRLAAAYPDAPVFQSTCARALKDTNRFDRALAMYRASAKRWPTDATLLHDLAVAAGDASGAAGGTPRGRALRDEAIRAEQASIALAPDNASAHNGLGLALAQSGRDTDAARAFERATAIDPRNASYWTNLGNARRALADRAGATRAYEEALKVDGRTVDAANGLGVLLVEAGRPADAAAMFRRALDASPGFVDARLNLGIALQQSGDRAGSAAAFREVLKAPARFTRERRAAAALLAQPQSAR